MNRPRFPVKRVPDGRALINLGSNTRVAPGWTNVDFSWIIRLGRHPALCRLLHRLGLLSHDRYGRILRLDPTTVSWDLRKGIPFPDLTFDAVYHCHVLEHIDREFAPVFLRECFRVLKPAGILRAVVPDLEHLARVYLDTVERVPSGATMDDHLRAVENMIDQMVVRTPRIRREQKLIVRWAEHILVGDTARAGVLHRWMYDRLSLGKMLRDMGFLDVREQTDRTSQIAGWESFNLDTDPDGSPYKPGSLYMEGRRP